MPPTISGLVVSNSNISNLNQVKALLWAQWTNPKDILSILLLLGPDIVQNAVAQLAGRVVSPAAFSFGRVAYSTAALVHAFGDGRLMPSSDLPNTIVVHAESGHCRASTNWVLGRILRDAQNRVHANTLPKQPKSTSQSRKRCHPAINKSHPEWEALRVEVYEVDGSSMLRQGIPVLDWVWYYGVIVILIQLGLSLLPWMIHNDWAPFLVTITGTTLAVVEASLPQWRREKWFCPKKGSSIVSITQGNGSRYAMLILGHDTIGLNLEIMATAVAPFYSMRFTRLMSCILAILWICLLITVAGLQKNTWYLLGIGLIGSIQNLYAAGMPRNSSAMGLHLKEVETPIKGKSVADVLKEVERRYPMVGTSLLGVFFPNGLRVSSTDEVFWKAALATRYAPTKHGIRLSGL